MHAIDSNPSTSLTLIRRMVEDSASDHAWPEFHRRYRAVLLRWCRHWGVSPQDTDDVVQESLVAVFRFMPEFERRRKGAFRSWMKLIALRAWRTHLRKEARTLAGDRLRDVENCGLFCRPPVVVGDMLAILDRMADEEIFDLALCLVRDHVSDEVWEIFDLSELRREPVAKIAASKGISATAVRVNNFRVRKLLRNFVERLDPS